MPRKSKNAKNSEKKKDDKEFPEYRSRKFSIVQHQATEMSKQMWNDFLVSMNPLEYLVSREPNPPENGEGFHIHVYVQFKNDRWSTRFFNFHKFNKVKLVTNRPADCNIEGEWGRLQVDPMRGKMPHADKYLTNPDKDKEIDPDVIKFNLEEKQRDEDISYVLNQMMTPYLYPDMGGYFTQKARIRHKLQNGEELGPQERMLLNLYHKYFPKMA